MITLHARLEKRPKPHARKTAQGRAQESTNAGEPLLEFRTTSISVLLIIPTWPCAPLSAPISVIKETAEVVQLHACWGAVQEPMCVE